MDRISRQLQSAWHAYIREFGVKETFTLLQLEHAIRLAHTLALREAL